MSMQIGLMPAGQEKILFRQQDSGTRAATLFGKDVPPLPGGNRNVPENKAPDIRATTQDLERISLAFNKRLKFVVDHESQEVIVNVIDTETDKVIKVLPPEELQRLHQRLRETIGFLFDQRV